MSALILIPTFTHLQWECGTFIAHTAVHDMALDGQDVVRMLRGHRSE